MRRLGLHRRCRDRDGAAAGGERIDAMSDKFAEINDRILVLHGWRKIGKREHCERQCYTDGNIVSSEDKMLKYTSDMSATWSLVEEMLEAGFAVTIIADQDAEKALCSIDAEGRYRFLDEAETAQLAICGAYIAWKEGLR
jgi:hypothetical protein